MNPSRPPSYVNTPVPIAYAEADDALIVTMTRILGLCWRHDYERTPPLTPDELGELVGRPRTTLYRHLAILEKELGWLRIERRNRRLVLRPQVDVTSTGQPTGSRARASSQPGNEGLRTALAAAKGADYGSLALMGNIKRTWLTVQRIQQTSGLVPIPHLQWATRRDLARQLDYAREQGFHTLTLNLQMIKRQGWDTVAMGLPLLQASGLRFLFTGVASLRRLAELARLFPGASFSNTTAHYLAQRGVRLQRDGTRLIKEPVVGHPDLVLVENVALYREFLAEVR